MDADDLKTTTTDGDDGDGDGDQLLPQRHRGTEESQRVVHRFSQIFLGRVSVGGWGVGVGGCDLWVGDGCGCAGG
jgi:hypothetical protein